MKEQYQVLTQAFVARKIMSDADLTALVTQINQASPGLSNDGMPFYFIFIFFMIKTIHHYDYV